jgi:hypothetical protein
MSQPRIFGPVFSAAVLAALTLAAGPGRAAAEDCLAGPNGSAPQGRHWHYHLDRATHRKCWHVSSDGAKAGQSAGRPAAQSVTRATPTQAPEPQPWVAPPVQAMPRSGSPEAQPIWSAMSSPQTVDAGASGMGSGAAALGAGVPVVAGVPVAPAIEPAPSDPGQTAGPGPAPSPIATGGPAATATAAPIAEASPNPDPSATDTMSLPTVAPAGSAPEKTVGERQPVGPHHSVAMIGGALALATGVGLAISGWLVRRRDALQHRDAAEHDRDVAHFRDDTPPFIPPGPEAFRPRRRAPAVPPVMTAILPVITDEEIAEIPIQTPREERRRVRVEELEERLRDVMQQLRRSAA